MLNIDRVEYCNTCNIDEFTNAIFCQEHYKLKIIDVYNLFNQMRKVDINSNLEYLQQEGAIELTSDCVYLTYKHIFDMRLKLLSRLDLEVPGECEVPNGKFWDFYNEKKDLFYQAGFYVRKTDGGKWLIGVRKFKPGGKYTSKDMKFKQQLENHKPICALHGKVTHFNRRFKSNQVALYHFYCHICEDEFGGELPHSFIGYEDFQGFDIIEIPYTDLARVRRRKYYDKY